MRGHVFKLSKAPRIGAKGQTRPHSRSKLIGQNCTLKLQAREICRVCDRDTWPLGGTRDA